MAKYAILLNNGYRLDFECEVEAKSPQAARAAFLKMEAGSSKARWVAENPKNLRATRLEARAA